MRERDASQSHPTILVAEGDAPLRRWLGVLLREAGYDVLEAGAESEVVSYLRSRTPIHLVVTDARLGRVPGWEIAQDASTLRPGIPIVRLVGTWAEGVPIYRSELDRSMLLWKPFTLPELLEAIGALLSRDPEVPTKPGPAVEFSTGPYTFYLASPPR